MKSWYQVQEKGMEVVHRGKTAKAGELIYLTKAQAKLHDKAVAIADKPPEKIAEVTVASDFNEWKEVEKKAVKPETTKKSSSRSSSSSK